MSGTGKSNKGGTSKSSKSDTKNTNTSPQPTIVYGWQYHQYAQSSPDRYAYIGKDEDTGEPEFMDYGPKSSSRK